MTKSKEIIRRIMTKSKDKIRQKMTKSKGKFTSLHFFQRINQVRCTFSNE